MVKPNQSAAPCSRITHPGMRAACEETKERCAEGTKGKNATACTEAVSFCATNETWPASLETDHGQYIAVDRPLCFRLVSTFTRLGHTILTTGSSKPVQTKESVGGPPERSMGTERVDTRSRETVAPADGAPPATDTPALCAPLKQTPNWLTACADMVARCTEDGSWPRHIETPWGRFTPTKHSTCMEIAEILVHRIVSGDETEAQPSTPPARKEPSPQAPPKQTPPNSSAAPLTPIKRADPAKHLIMPFSHCGIRRLGTTGTSRAEIRRTLHFPDGKGLPMRLRYSLKPFSDGRYVSMEYTIFRGRKPIGGKQSIVFEQRGTLNLGFEIQLRNPHDYSRITSMSIVPLD